MSLVGRVFSNRYEIERELAQGGMAEVYLAHDRLLDRPVALKALFPEYAREPSFVERFRREAQAAANLNDPNIVGIYDWGQEAGTYFIVMEYVEGRSLRDLIRSEGPLDAEPGRGDHGRDRIRARVRAPHRCRAPRREARQRAAHARRARVKVTDFGIARAGTSDGLTQTGSVMGTATYFSPEQAQGLPVDGRSDVYSLGVVLYEMVTGVAPFTGDSPVAVAYKHVREEPVPPTQRNPDVPADLEQIILTALAKDPDHRYQTADDMRADLLRFRRGRPLSAAPVTALVAEVRPAAARAGAAAAHDAHPPRVPARRPPAEPRRDPPARARHRADGARPRGARRARSCGFSLLADDGGGGGTVLVPDVVGQNDRRRDRGARRSRPRRRRPSASPTTRSRPTSSSARTRRPTQRIDEGEHGDAQRQLGRRRGRRSPTSTSQLTDRRHDARCEQLGFEVETAAPSRATTVDAGRVIRTDPAGGRVGAARGSIVRHHRVVGREQVPVPDVVGLQSEEASGRARPRPASSADEASESSDTVESGHVIRTDPPADATRAARFDACRMFVSSGTRTVAVPEVRGQPLEADAAAHSRTPTCTVDRDRTGLDARATSARCSRSRREPGTRVAPGTQHRADGRRQQRADDDDRAADDDRPRDVLALARWYARARPPRPAVAGDA